MRKFLAGLTLTLAPLWAAGEHSNRRAPGFSLPDVNLQQHDLADYRGKVVLLEVMLTTCPHCVKFGKTLEEIGRKYAGRVHVLAMVIPPDTLISVNQFVKDHGISYPILFDCGQASGSYLQASPKNPNVDVPHVFVIDQNGYIKDDYGYGVLTTGIFEGRDLFGVVEKLLGVSPGPASKAPAKK